MMFTFTRHFQGHDDVILVRYTSLRRDIRRVYVVHGLNQVLMILMRWL